MSEALAPPFAVAALLLCVAGAFKLRSPHGAVGALRALGLPAGAWTVRALATGELALGVLCVVDPARATAVVLTGAYATFAWVAAALARRRVACGCFGDNDLPVSRAHVIAIELLGALAAAAALASPRGLGWLANQPLASAVVIALGIAGTVYALVLLYTVVPRAWATWSGQ